MQSAPTVYLWHEDSQVRRTTHRIADAMGYLVSESDSLSEFLESYDDSRDGCLIAALDSAQVGAVELVQAIRNQSIEIPIIFVSIDPDWKTAVDVMKRGAITVLEIPLHDDALHEAVDEAIGRDAAERQQKLRLHLIQERLATLSDKERQVLDLVVEGIANKVIANRLGVSIRTVESRRQAIFHKMQVQSLAELVRNVVDARP